jgi:hypothetical protein
LNEACLHSIQKHQNKKMKTKFYLGLILLIITTKFTSAQNANTSLSNLKATKVNASLVPDTNALRSLGSATKGWKNLYYTGGLYAGGKRILMETKTANTFLGINTAAATSTGDFNTALGSNSLFANTSGYANTAAGSNALHFNTTGHDNTATGFYSLYANTTGAKNTAAGVYALTSNTTGTENTVAGYSALSSNTTGSYNVAEGLSALALNTVGGNNTAVGYRALGLSTTGYSNTAIGFNALDSNSDGTGNVALGSDALSHTIFGNYNIGIGTNAGQTNAYTDNNIIIGYQPVDKYGTSNTVEMGNSSTIYMVAQVGWSQFSDGRVKDNIKQDVPGLAFINKLKPVTYNFNLHRENEMLSKGKKDNTNWRGKYDLEKKKMTGFIAQDVEIAANALDYDFSGVQKPATPDALYALNYSEFVVPLVKAVQELSAANDKLKEENNTLEKRMAKLESILIASQHTNAASNKIINDASSLLEQNFPNPFNRTTLINYTLPQNISTAQIIITDNNGKVIKQFTIAANGKNSISIDASTLNSGTYNYSLYANGQLIASKQMVVTK